MQNDYSNESESDEEEFVAPTSFLDWFDRYYDVIVEIYTAFQSHGRTVFGEAFHQFGHIESFARYIYTRTRP